MTLAQPNSCVKRDEGGKTRILLPLPLKIPVVAMGVLTNSPKGKPEDENSSDFSFASPKQILLTHRSPIPLGYSSGPCNLVRD